MAHLDTPLQRTHSRRRRIDVFEQNCKLLERRGWVIRSDISRLEHFYYVVSSVTLSWVRLGKEHVGTENAIYEYDDYLTPDEDAQFNADYGEFAAATVHNHPSGSPISATDILSLVADVNLFAGIRPNQTPNIAIAVTQRKIYTVEITDINKVLQIYNKYGREGCKQVAEKAYNEAKGSQSDKSLAGVTRLISLFQGSMKLNILNK